MSTPNQLSLLRRTFTVIAAVAALAAVSDALAQGKVKLNNASGNECSYTSLSITPDGSVTVQCSGGTSTPTPTVDPTIPGTFAMTTASMNVAPSSSAQVGVTRTLGSLATTVWYWTGGDGCDPTVGGLNFAGGQMSNSIPIPVKLAGTSCTVTLSPAAPAVAGSPSATTLTVSSGVPTPTPTPGGCPATPQDMLTASLTGIGNPLVQKAASGQVVSIKLPAIPNTRSGQVNIGETTITTQPATLEISINKCPGVVEVNSFEGQNWCNYRTQNGSMTNLTYITQPLAAPYDNAAAINSQGLCWAADGGDIYLNARWIYPSCPWGNGSCGYFIQYGYGPY